MNSKIQDHALEQYSDEEAIGIEDGLWWFQGRKAIIRSYLEAARQVLPLTTIMDIGCGSGGNLAVLSEFGKVLGVERSAVLAQRARSRGIAAAIIEKDAGELDEIRDVQLFTFFDVLEHIENDLDFLKKIGASAHQKHLVLISVPASPFLYGEHDKILHHYRRYSRQMLQQTLEQAGYRLHKIHYFMSFLFPFALLDRLKDQFLTSVGKNRQSVNLGIVPPLLNKLFISTLELEARAAAYLPFPAGLWLFALAEKQE